MTNSYDGTLPSGYPLDYSPQEYPELPHPDQNDGAAWTHYANQYVADWIETRDCQHLEDGREDVGDDEIDDALLCAEVVEPERPFELDGIRYTPRQTKTVFKMSESDPRKMATPIYRWHCRYGSIRRGPKPLDYETVRAKTAKLFEAHAAANPRGRPRLEKD